MDKFFLGIAVGWLAAVEVVPAWRRYRAAYARVKRQERRVRQAEERLLLRRLTVRPDRGYLH